MPNLALDVRSLARPHSSFARVVRLIQAGAAAVELPLESWEGGRCSSDLLWTPHADLPPVEPGPRLIVTLHDINPLLGGGRRLFARMRHAGRFRRKVRQVMQEAWRINTGSDDAATRLQDAFPGLPQPWVTPWYASAEFRPAEPGEDVAAAVAAHDLEPGFLLYLGALRPHKNWRLVLEAYAALAPSLRERHPLVMVGRRHRAGAEADRLAAKLGIGGELCWLEALPDEDLPWLYRAAAGFLFPSLAEGFGLPPLEAQACGAPVLAARATSLPEVLGDGALLLDPHDAPAWTAAMAHLLSAPEAATDLARAGQANAGRFHARRLGEAVVRMVEAP